MIEDRLFSPGRAAKYGSIGTRLVAELSRRPGLVVILVAVAWSLFETAPTLTHFTQDIYGAPGDATGTLALFWWWTYAVQHGLSLFDNSLQGVPLGSGWENIPFNVLPIIIITPVALLIGPIAAYNLEVLSSFPLTAWTTFLLARRLGMRPLSAAFAGLAFAAIPLHIQKATGHSGQAHMEFFPATLIFLLRWRQGGSRWNLGAAGLIGGLQLWTDFYFTAILSLMVAVFFIVSAISKSTVWPQLSKRIGAHLTAGVLMLLAAALLLPPAVLVAHRPSALGYFASAQAAALPVVRTKQELIIYSARPWFYIVPPPDNPIVPNRVRAWENFHIAILGNNGVESGLFVGYTVMLLGIVALVAGSRGFPATLCTAFLAAGFVFSLPPDYSLPLLHIHAPSDYLYALVPFIRVYGRFGVLVLLGACLLAGLGHQVLESRSTGRWLRSVVLLAPFLLVAIEFNNVPPFSAHLTRILPAPAEYSWLRDQPSGILIEYPLVGLDTQRQEVYSRQYSLNQIVHEHPTFNTAEATSPAGDYAPRLEPYYGPGVVASLRSLGIHYVFVHRSEYQANGRDLPHTVYGLTFVTTLDNTDIYEVAGS